MTFGVLVECPHCHSTEVVKHSKSAVGKQRYRYQNKNCPYRTFVLDQTYPGRTRQVKQQVVEMTLNGSGVRDITRVLHISSTAVGFSKTEEMHDIAISLLINRYEFGLPA